MTSNKHLEESVSNENYSWKGDVYVCLDVNKPHHQKVLARLQEAKIPFSIIPDEGPPTILYGAGSHQGSKDIQEFIDFYKSLEK